MSNQSQKFPLFIQVSRTIRHIPYLASLSLIWDAVRPLYKFILYLFYKDSGFPLDLDGITRIYVPVNFVSGEVDALELPMLKKFFQLVTPETCLYDIGASIGLHSLVAGSIISNQGEIHAFEPDLPSCEQFLKNTSLISRKVPIYLSRCFVSDCGSSINDLKQFSPIKEIGESPKANSSSRHLYLFKETDVEGISQISLDSYVACGARPPTVIKCDIEGAELLFLRGAVNTLRQYKPTLFISLHPDLIGCFGVSEKDFYDFLKVQGYQWEILNEVGETHVYAYSSV